MILRHRDRELLRFEWGEPQGVRVVSVNDAERRFLPIEMHGVANDETLWSWLTRRTVPRNRRNIEELMVRIGLSSRNVKGIIELCRGLSLNDVYWVVPDGFDGSWKDFNLYENDFSDAIAQMAFSGAGPDFREQWTSSPEWLGFPSGLTLKMKERLEGLRGFRIKHHSRYNLSARRIEAIEDFTQKRIREICEYGVKADDLLKIVAVPDSVNHIEEGSLALQIKSNLNADPFMTYVELAELLQVSASSIARKIKYLQASGEIRRVGADKNGHWEVCK